MLKKARVLLFDEGTSALDGRTEFEVLRNLACLSSGRTTLVVAHRLATVVNADVIVVLHEGRVVESGTHAQLLRLRGHFGAMARAASGNSGWSMIPSGAPQRAFVSYARQVLRSSTSFLAFVAALGAFSASPVVAYEQVAEIVGVVTALGSSGSAEDEDEWSLSFSLRPWRSSGRRATCAS